MKKHNVLIIASNIPQARKLFRLLELTSDGQCVTTPSYNKHSENGTIEVKNTKITIVANHSNPIIRGQRYDEVYNFSSIMDIFMDRFLEGISND